MDGQLAKGTTLQTELGGTVEIIQFLAEGGQGEVYIVKYNGTEKKALKWYKKAFIKSLDDGGKAFYDNIKHNVLKGAPSDEFLWMQDITKWKDGLFGYIMDLRPNGYYELTEFSLLHQNFSSYKTVIDVALKIVSAYRILHNAGYSYQDLNDGNFFINPTNGKVLICDNDNVAPDGTPTGIKGKPRFMAPEVVLNSKMPDSLSDRFSMSIILYILFCLNHPLEGKRYLKPGLTTEDQTILYGKQPLFIMNPDDDSNGPHPKIHNNSIIMWKCLPKYMKDIFLASFCSKAYEKPSSRPKELDWLKVLTRFRSEIISCQCGNEVFTENGRSCNCEKCGKRIEIPFRIDFIDYSIPALKGSRIYRCQIGICDEKDALTPVAQLLENKETKKIGVKNKTDKRWDALTPSKVSKKVQPDSIVPLVDGIELIIENESIKISKN